MRSGVGSLAGRVAATLAAVIALTAAGCSPEVLFVGDPVFQATLPRPDAFEEAVREAAASASMRAEIHWPAERIDSLALAPLLRNHDAPVVALTPYLSLLAAEVVVDFPRRRFIGFYGDEPLANVTWVDYDAVPAMTEAGAALARWVFAGTGRSAVVLVDESDRAVAEEGRALAAGYLAEAGVDPELEVFRSAPTRETVRSRVQALPPGGERAVVALLGPATAWALEFLRDETTLVAFRHGYLPRDARRVLFTVRDDVATGIARALAEGGERVVAPSVLDLSPAHFPSSRRRQTP